MQDHVNQPASPGSPDDDALNKRRCDARPPDARPPDERPPDEQLPDELTEFARQLGSFAPRASKLDRDALLFVAGQAAAMSQLAREGSAAAGSSNGAVEHLRSNSDRHTRRRIRDFVWPMATAVMTMVSVSLGTTLALRPELEPRVVIVEREQPQIPQHVTWPVPNTVPRDGVPDSNPPNTTPATQAPSHPATRSTEVTMLRSGRTASDGEITLDSVSRVWSTRVEAMALAQRRIEQSHALRDGDADGSGGTPPASLPVLRAGMIGARSSDMIQKFLEEQL